MTLDEQIRVQTGVNIAIELAAVRVRRDKIDVSWSVIYDGKMLRGMIHADGSVEVSSETIDGLLFRLLGR